MGDGTVRWVHCLAPWQRAAFGLLVVLHLAAPIYAIWPPAGGALVAALQDALPLAQMALLAVWLVLGPGNGLIRSPALLGIAWLLWREGSFAREDFELLWKGDLQLSRLYYAARMESDYPVVLLALHAAMLVAALAALRAFGFRLRAEPVTLNAPHQYSLRTLFLLTTTVALALSLAEQLRGIAPAEGDVPKPLALIAAAVAFAAAALLALRGALAPGSPLMRSVVSIGLCGGVGAGLACVCARESDWLLMASWLMGFGSIVSGSLLVVRACGYHLAHREEIVESAFTLPHCRTVVLRPSVQPFLLELEKA
jgi:hypothetical protein